MNPGAFSRAWLLSFTWFLSFALASIAFAQSYPVDANGWSIITPSADSRLIYVSAAGNDATAQVYSVAQVGSDARNPVIAVNAFRTLAAARAQMRIGSPDWMLFKRGEAFPDEINLGGQFLAGRSGTERMVFTHYGVSGNRPLLGGAYWSTFSQGTGNFAIVGLEVYYRERDPASPFFVSFATKHHTILRVIDSRTGNILVEDCVFRHGADNITMDFATPPLFAANIDIRRSAVWDAHNDTTAGTDAQPDRASGIFVNGVNNLKIEDCFIDHNGWAVDAAGNLAGRGRAFYSHNIYLQNGSNNSTVRNSIISRSASVGVQARAGNYLTNNLFVLNAIGAFSAAYGNEVGEGNVNEVVGNVLIAGDDHLPTTWPENQAGNRGIGLEVKRTDQGLYQGNILLDEASISDASYALYGESGTGSQLIRVWDNIVRNWKASNGQSFYSLNPTQYDLQNNIVDGVNLSTNESVLFSDGMRTLSTYLTSVGGAGDNNAFLASARAAWLGAPRSFPAAYRATVVNDYFREGFTIVGTSELPGVAVTPTSVQLELGGTRQFNAIVTPTGANQAVTWSTANPAVATVSATGLVTATGLGVTNITATSIEGGHTSSSNVSVSPVGGISIPFSDAAVTIDGEPDASYSGLLGVISKPEDGEPVPATSNISGAWRARFDATNLYLHIEITDDVLNNDNPDYWHNDGVEIFFDGNNSKGSSSDGIDDIKIAFIPQPNGTVLISTDVWPPNPAGADFSGVQAAYVLRVDGGIYRGYGLEIKVPFSLLGGTPSAGRQIGLDFQINDNDDGGARDRVVTWYGTQLNNHPYAYGTATLGASAGAISVTGVSVSPTTATVFVGTTQQLAATVLPANASNPAVTWHSNNAAVATVSDTGLVTALAPGNATITAVTQDGGFFAGSVVTVPLPPGSAANVLAVLTPLTRKPAASTPVYDSPTNNDFPGALYHTGAHDYRSGLFIFQLPAIGAPITSVTFNAYYKSVGTGFSVSLFGHDAIADIAALPPAQTYWGYGPAAGQPGTELKANFVGDGAAMNTVGWVSTDVTNFIRDHYVAGQYIVLRVGSTFNAPADAASESLHPTSRAMFDGGASAATNNQVPYLTIATSGASIPVTGVSVAPTGASLFVGDTQQLSATVVPANAANPAATWASSNPAVATVSASGLVTAVSAGNVTITVTTVDGGFTATSAITVTVPVPGGTVSNVLAALTPQTRKPAAGTPVYDSPTNNDFPGALYHTGAHDYRSGLFIFQLPPLDGAITEVTFNAYYKSVGTGFSVSLFGHDAIADIATLPPAETYWGYGPAAGQPGTELKASFVGDGAAVNEIGWVSTNVTNFIRDHYVAGQYIVLRVGSTFNAPADAASESLHPTSRAMFDGGSSAVANNHVPYLTITASGASVSVTGVSVDSTESSLLVGSTQQLTASVAPANAANPSVTWSSSHPAVATVSASGLVTAVSAGNATITVMTVDGGFTATSAITVTVPVPGGTVSNVLAALTPQTRKPAAGTPVYDSPTNNDFPGALYHTGAHDYRSGLFIFQLPPLDGAITEVTFNAYYKSVGTGFSVSLFGHDAIADIATLPPAETYWGYGPAAGQPGTELKASFVGDGAAVNAIGWVSTNVTNFIRDHYVAGQYIVLRVGSTFNAPADAASESLHPTSRAMFDGGSSAVANNQVPYLTITTSGASVPVTGVSVDPTTASLLVGDTQQLTATSLPANAANSSVTWSSSNPAVATVSESGLVTAMSAGNATITVTTDDGGFTATSTITVDAPLVIPVSGVSVDPGTASVPIGATQLLTATITPANATNPSVTWSSSDPAVATVSSSGLVTAVASGHATITVETQSGGFTVTAEITVPASSATVTLGNTSQIYNGSPRAVSVTTSPADLTVAVTYNGSPDAPTDAGSYSVVAVLTDPNYTGTAAGTLVITPALATLTLGDLEQRYDGTPKGVTVTTAPEDLTVTLTYDGAHDQPWTSGAHTVEVTIDDPNYTGNAMDTLVIVPTAFVRHAPVVNGGVEGSVHLLTGENLTLSGNAWISGDLLAPGTPDVHANVPTYVGTLDGTGDIAPTGYAITLNPDSVVRHVVRRAAPFTLQSISPPPAPTGTRSVTLTAAGQSPGDFATLRNLTLAGAAGAVALPPGSYGNVILNGGGTLVLGIVGAEEPAVYDFQSLTVNPLLMGTGRIEIVGPVLVTVAGNAALFGAVGNPGHPEWLVLRSASGGISTNGLAQVYGHLAAPNGAVNLLGGSKVVGLVRADRLTIAPNALLEDPAPITDDDGLPSPWLTQDIGAVAATGTSAYSGGTFTIEGSGADIWETSDEFRYVYQSASGDCTIVARVTGVENTDTWAKVGVMIRETLNANSAYAFTSMSPNEGGTAMFSARLSAGTSTSSEWQAAQTVPRWVRIVRTENTFTGSYSADGTTWTSMGSVTIVMGSNVYIGLAVTSHDNGTLCTGTFTNVTATP